MIIFGENLIKTKYGEDTIAVYQTLVTIYVFFKLLLFVFVLILLSFLK